MKSFGVSQVKATAYICEKSRWILFWELSFLFGPEGLQNKHGFPDEFIIKHDEILQFKKV